MPLLLCYPHLRLPKNIRKGFYNMLIADASELVKTPLSENFCASILHSPSLDLKGKHNVFSTIPTLVPRQYAQLTEVFREEQEKFLKMRNKEPYDILTVVSRSLYESVLLAYLYNVIPKETPEKDIVGRMVYKWLKKDNESKNYCEQYRKNNAIIHYFLGCRDSYLIKLNNKKFNDK